MEEKQNTCYEVSGRGRAEPSPPAHLHRVGNTAAGKSIPRGQTEADQIPLSSFCGFFYRKLKRNEEYMQEEVFYGKWSSFIMQSLLFLLLFFFFPWRKGT